MIVSPEAFKPLATFQCVIIGHNKGSYMALDFALEGDNRKGFDTLFAHARDWSSKHQKAIGLCEIAVGVALVTAGIQSGAVEVGVQIVANVLENEKTAEYLGAGSGIFGMLPGLIAGNIGITAMGTAFAVPALLLMGGGGLIFGLAGYGAGKLFESFAAPAWGLAQTLGTGALAVGIALIIDGARRIAKDLDIPKLAAKFKDYSLHLGRLAATATITRLQDLTSYLSDDIGAFLEDLVADPKKAALAAGLTAGGAAAGSTVAASTVTVLGSKALGGMALSLGLVSAPLWPVIAGGGLAVATAYGVWKLTRQKQGKTDFSGMTALGWSDKPQIPK